MAAKTNNIIEEMQRSIESLQQRVDKLEAEMFRQEFWRKPAPPKVTHPLARATDCDWWNEVGGTGMIHIRFKYECPCHATHQTVHRVAAATPSGFSKVFTCENGKAVEVVFPQR